MDVDPCTSQRRKQRKQMSFSSTDTGDLVHVNHSEPGTVFSRPYLQEVAAGSLTRHLILSFHPSHSTAGC